MNWLELRAVQLVAFAVLHPWSKPLIAPVARWLMRRCEILKAAEARGK